MSSDDSVSHPQDYVNIYGNNTTDDIDLASDFFKSICEQVHDGIKEGGEVYEEWLMKGPLPESDILVEISKNSNEVRCVRFISLFCLLRQYPPSKYNRHQEETLEALPDEYGGHSMYNFCKFLLYRDGDVPTLREEAFVNGTKAAENIHTNTKLYYEIASLGLEIVRQSNISDKDFHSRNLTRDELLSKSAKFAKRAISTSPDIPGHYLVYGSVLELQGEFEKALEVLRRGRNQCTEGGSVLENPLGGITSAAEEVPEFNKKINDIQRKQRRHNLEKNIKDAGNKLENIESELSRVENELEETTNEYRAQTFQFIGFFAAIVTIALTSVQIATTLTFAQASGLILVLVGAIVLAFGELNFLFASTKSESSRSRNWGTFVSGVILVVAGLAIGTLL